jgi:acetyltransferase-like isoleucine patch superfamily enzyme
MLLPWPLKRRALTAIYGYNLDPSARISFSWVWPRKLVMGENARIGLFNVAIHLDLVEMGEQSSIGRGNWITGFPSNGGLHFEHQLDRNPELLLGRHSAVTKNHHLDCTDTIEIGDFATVAGYGSQFLTHSIDIIAGRQHSEPIKIGAYTFVGTNCTVLGGAVLPDYSVLGAKALLNKPFRDFYCLYGGVPAKRIKSLPRDARYFGREQGFVY